MTSRQARLHKVKSFNRDDGNQWVETIEVSPMVQFSIISVG